MDGLQSQAEFKANGLQSTQDVSSRVDGACPICFNLLKSPVKTACGHVYCTACANHWFESSTTCPDCRTPLFNHSNLPPRLATHLPAHQIPLVLPFDVDQAAVIDAFEGFETMMDEEMDLAVPPQDSVYIDNHDQLPSAIGAANWLQLPDDSVDFSCYDDWVKVCNAVHSFLQQWDGKVVRAEYMRDVLMQAIWDAVVWDGQTHRMPRNREGDLGWERTDTFEKDLDTLVAFVVLCAQQRYQDYDVLQTEGAAGE